MSPRHRSLGELAGLLPRTTLVAGKGGVGKTTCAVRLARGLAADGHKTLLISTDPAAALSTVLGAAVSARAEPVAGAKNLFARQLDATELRAEFLSRWRDVIAEIVDRGTYLDRADVDGLVDAALPGADEIFALLAIADLLAAPEPEYARIVVDTAPTGHTLRLLALPDTFRALVAMLELMQQKHRFMVRALTHRYRRDAADDFLDEMGRRIETLKATLADERSSAAVVVTRLEPVVLAETERYVEALRALRVPVAAIVANAVPDGAEASPERAIERLDILQPSTPLVVLPWEPALAGQTSAAPGATPRASARRLAPRPTNAAAVAGLVAPLTVVAGKGGVGKSTVSCALAIAAVDAGDGPVLLVSTDPAPSLADALGQSREPWAARDTEHELPAVPGLVVRQMDATAAFARLRDEYQTRIDALFAALVSRNVDVEHDRAILRELLSLAPPGIDELLALSLLGDALDARRFSRIVVDPAPTGHLLRLLDMPAVALEWTHRLMRLMLKYRDVVALGDTAQELLDFSRRTRAFAELLRDASRAAMILVSLDEPVVRAESARLVQAAAEREIPLRAAIWNRVHDHPVPLPAPPSARQFFAGERRPAPVGVTALREWVGSWHELQSLS